MSNAPTYRTVALEGIDGCGKGTQIGNLARELRRRGITVVRSRQPSKFSDLGEFVRECFTNPDVTEDELNVLLAADRILTMRRDVPRIVTKYGEAFQVDEVVVVSDRSVLSAYAYHGLHNPMHPFLSPASVWPDLAIVLDVPLDLALERVGKTNDRFERRDRMEAARARYHSLAQTRAPTVKLVDGVGSTYEVAARVLAEVEAWLA